MPSSLRLGRVEHVMGMPIVVDVRDERRRRHASTTCSTGCAGSTRRSAPTSPTARSAGSTAASSRSTDAHPDVREVLARCEELRGETDGYFDVRARVAARSTRQASSRAGRSTAPPRSSTTPGLANYAINAGGDIRLRGGALPGAAGASGSSTRTSATGRGRGRGRATSPIATSGAYARGEHVVDPHTGGRPTGVLSVTITGPDLATADAYATAAFAMGAHGPHWTATAARLRGDDDPRRRARAPHARLPGSPLASCEAIFAAG